ncbi:hypothetical protein PT113_07440 [Erysipelothrix rhusiopathiae]|nr:hypothetical protein [Erysipelothrix rhusiopathiae]
MDSTEIIVIGSMLIIGCMLIVVFALYQNKTYINKTNFMTPFKLKFHELVLFIVYLLICAFLSNVLKSLQSYFIYLIVLCIIIVGMLIAYIYFGVKKTKLMMTELKKIQHGNDCHVGG